MLKYAQLIILAQERFKEEKWEKLSWPSSLGKNVIWRVKMLDQIKEKK